MIDKITIKIKPSILKKLSEEFNKEALLITKRINEENAVKDTKVISRLDQVFFEWEPEVDREGRVSNF